MAKDNKKPAIKFFPNENLQTIFADNILISKRKDGIYYIRFTTQLPDGFKEQVRLIVQEKNLRAMLDLLCSQSDYYPINKKEASS